MPETDRTLCPTTGQICDARVALLDLQMQMSVEASTPLNIITDHDRPGIRLAKRLANFASSNTHEQRVRGIDAFNKVVDEAFDARHVRDCMGTFCGTLGNLVIGYSETFMPDANYLQFRTPRDKNE